jgi:hypothetical protein
MVHAFMLIAIILTLIRLIYTLAGVDETDKFHVFERWLLDNGSLFPKLELKVILMSSIDNFVMMTCLRDKAR